MGLIIGYKLRPCHIVPVTDLERLLALDIKQLILNIASTFKNITDGFWNRVKDFDPLAEDIVTIFPFTSKTISHANSMNI